METDDGSGPRRFRFLRSLRHRNFRLLWIGSGISYTGDWLDQIALNWLVLEQTGSALHLGLVNLCRGLPIMLFALLGGALADRSDRRKLMLCTQSGAMVLAALLALLVLTDRAPIWAIFLIATLRGVLFSLNMPARQSLISHLVPRADLANALALNNMTLNLSKVLGPLLSGVIIAAFGSGICFALNALTFTAVLWTLTLMDFPPQQARVNRDSIGREIASGLRFVRGHKVILMLVLLSIVPTFFAQPYMNLLAIFAFDVLRTGPIGLGQLTAAAGMGSVLGGFCLAQFGDRLQTGLAMLLMLIGFGLSLGVFAMNTSVLAAPMILVIVGVCFMGYNIIHASLLQLTVPDEYRGRVLSVLFLNRGLVSLGTATFAALAGAIGAPTAFLVMAGVVFSFAAALLVLSPDLRRLAPFARR